MKMHEFQKDWISRDIHGRSLWIEQTICDPQDEASTMDVCIQAQWHSRKRYDQRYFGTEYLDEMLRRILAEESVRDMLFCICAEVTSLTLLDERTGAYIGCDLAIPCGDKCRILVRTVVTHKENGRHIQPDGCVAVILSDEGQIVMDKESITKRFVLPEELASKARARKAS